MQRVWTHGPGSDVKAKWPACRGWREEDWDDQRLTMLVRSIRQAYHAGEDMPLPILADYLEESGAAALAQYIRELLASTDFKEITFFEGQAHGSPGDAGNPAETAEIPF